MIRTVPIGGRLGTDLFNGVNVPVTNVKADCPNKPFRHMMEDGSTVIDSVVRAPKQVTVQLILTNRAMVQKVISTLTDKQNTYSIDWFGLTFRNMVVEENGFTVSPEMLIDVPTEIKFKELIVNPIVPVTSEQPVDGPSVVRGLVGLLTGAI